MTTKNMEKIDKLLKIIYKEIKAKTINDEEFSKSEKIKKIAFEIVEILKSEGVKVTYENLTNMNFHKLVQILNYNDFFKKELNNVASAYLKTFKLQF